MIGWLILAAYLAGFLLSWRSFALANLNALTFPDHIDNEDRAIAAVSGFFLAVAWPLTISVRTLFRLVVRAGLLTTDYERRQAESARINADRAELAEYRRLAREHGFPAPEVPDVK